MSWPQLNLSGGCCSGWLAGTDLCPRFANRADSGTNYANYNAIWQPLRNGDSGNLALALLGLPSIPGSTLIPQFPTSTPSLAVSAQSQAVTVEWSAAAVGFRLETADSLSPNTHWTPVTGGMVTNVDGYRYAVPLQAGPRFFRLKQ